MPGPIADCAKSTGAILLNCSFSRAGRSSLRRVLTRLRLVVWEAPSVRLRQTRTIDEASAFVPISIIRPPRSVRIGQVPVIEKPALIIEESIASQPVLAVLSSSVSLCLYA